MTNTQAETPTSDKTQEEMAETINGWDEAAIRQHMGYDPYAIVEAQPLSYVRALIFVDQTRRDGVSPAAAKKTAMDLTAKQLNAYFVDDEDELIPEEPETPSGKDD